MAIVARTMALWETASCTKETKIDKEACQSPNAPICHAGENLSCLGCNPHQPPFLTPCQMVVKDNKWIITKMVITTQVGGREGTASYSEMLRWNPTSDPAVYM